MSTCHDCRFWNRNGETYDNFQYTDSDNDFEDVFTEKKRCLKILHANADDNEKKHVNYLAVITDGSGYSASLFTESNFSCAMFECQPNSKPGAE